MIAGFRLLGVVGVVMAGGAPQAQPGVTYEPATTREQEVARLREHVTTLANPFFEGRASGSKGNELAAQYLEFWLKQIGLTPAFPEEITAHDGSEVLSPGGSFRQPFAVGQDVVVHSAAVEATPRGASGEGRAIRLVLHKDFEVLGISGSQEADGDLVFVGYGIEKGPEPDFAAFSSFKEGDDLKGKIALVLRWEPITEAGESQFTVGAWSDTSAMQKKLAALVKRGVEGVIITNPPGAKDPRAGALQTTAMTARRMGKPVEIPVVTVTMDRANQIVRAADGEHRSLEDLRKLADKGGGVIPLPGARATVSASVERPPRMTANVAGILPGKGDLAGQYLVIGAHFDHLGDATLGGSMKGEEGKIHFGADDNASGTAGMLVMAERLSRQYADLPAGTAARSIVFMGFSGEELGLLGSKYFVHSGRLSASSIYAMLNMDMIGRLREGQFELHGTGTADGFADLLRPMLDAWGIAVKQLPAGRGPSDHSEFYAGGIPVLFFFTGFHPEYHTPADTSRLVDCDGAVKVLDLVTPIAGLLSQRKEPLVFHSTDPPPREHAPRLPADQAAQAGPAQADQQQVGGVGGVVGTRVRFGAKPDYGDDGPGILVEYVSEGTSAAEAGVKAGDRLMKWNGAEIDNLETYMNMLGKHKPGDVVEITVKRDGKEVAIKATLKGNDSSPH